MNDKGEEILTELKALNEQISPEEIEGFLSLIENSRHIFLTGAGRSGLMIKAFANRLLHLGYGVSVIGEISTPHTQPNDLLIIGTASGNSSTLLDSMKKARQEKMKIALITANPNSKLIKSADSVIIIPVQSKDDEQETLQPMGSLFEQLSLILYDSIILRLMERKHESNATMKMRHANFE